VRAQQQDATLQKWMPWALVAIACHAVFAGQPTLKTTVAVQNKLQANSFKL
jgi:hypothetical protein